MNEIADDSRPMTGIWYRHRSDRNVLAKVIRVDESQALVISTGGKVQVYTFAKFAESWEMI